MLVSLMVGLLARFKSRFTKRPRRAAHLELGERGERGALEHLKDEDFEIVATNFRVPLGRSLGGQKVTGEIDIIAYEANTLVFIEVKTRTSDDLVAPERAVNLRKQQQIVRTARRYRQLMQVTGESYRYDVVTVIARPEGNKIELLRGFFNDSVLSAHIREAF